MPSLPGKDAVRGLFRPASQTFVRLRMAGLNRFLDSVLASPYLRTDAALDDFLTIVNMRDWKARQANAMGTSTSELQRQCAGFARWEADVAALSLTEAPNKTLDWTRSRHEEFNTSLRASLKVQSRLVEAAEALGAESAQFQQRASVHAAQRGPRGTVRWRRARRGRGLVRHSSRCRVL